MTSSAPARPLATNVARLSVALVALGILLWALAGKQFLWVAALGAFVPGLMREAGWLADHDEFQREAERTAGQRAYLVGGLILALTISALEWPGSDQQPSIEWLNLALVAMWLTWLFNVVLAYWGPVATASRVLLAVGSFWLLFVVASAFGEADPDRYLGSVLFGLLMGSLIVAPFFGLAWAARRWPRATGGLLLAVAVGFLVVFSPTGPSPLSLPTRLLTALLLVVPLVACGLGLLRFETSGDED